MIYIVIFHFSLFINVDDGITIFEGKILKLTLLIAMKHIISINQSKSIIATQNHIFIICRSTKAKCRQTETEWKLSAAKQQTTQYDLTIDVPVPNDIMLTLSQMIYIYPRTFLFFFFWKKTCSKLCFVWVERQHFHVECIIYHFWIIARICTVRQFSGNVKIEKRRNSKRNRSDFVCNYFKCCDKSCCFFFSTMAMRAIYVLSVCCVCA